MPKYMIAFFFFLNFGVVLCHPKYMKLSKSENFVFYIILLKKKKNTNKIIIKSRAISNKE